MERTLNLLSSISTTKYLKKLFISIANNNVERIEIIDDCIIIDGECIDINDYNDITKLYYDIVTIINKKLIIKEEWKIIKRNVRIRLLDDYYNHVCRISDLTEIQKIKFKNLLNLLLIGNKGNDIVEVVNGKIVRIQGLHMRNNLPYIEGIDEIDLSGINQTVKKICNKDINKFNNIYTRKYNSINKK